MGTAVMSAEAALWLTIAGMGLVTYLTRLLPLLLFQRWRLPPWLYRAMRYIPVAVLAAIILPELVLQEGVLALTPTNGRLWAGLVAGVVAWRYHRVLLTVAVGMAVLWALEAFLR
jgi:branched-subunit amino acid transport protein